MFTTFKNIVFHSLHILEIWPTALNPFEKLADSMQAHRLDIFKPQNVRPAFLSRAILHLTVKPRQGLLGPSPTIKLHKFHWRPTHSQGPGFKTLSWLHACAPPRYFYGRKRNVRPAFLSRAVPRQGLLGPSPTITLYKSHRRPTQSQGPGIQKS